MGKNIKPKLSLHPRNKHRAPYNFPLLIKNCPALEPFVTENKYGNLSIDFFDDTAVRLLNQVLLQKHYNIAEWSIPAGYLCPGVPGRADYIHYIADLLAEKNNGRVPKGKKVTCLDIGVGASCIYPIIGHQEYGWSFVGADIDPVSISNAQKIVRENPELTTHIDLRLQPKKDAFFDGIIGNDEFIDISICNPPFYGSIEEAHGAGQKKIKNLTGDNAEQVKSNFGGQANELWTTGGEQRFVQDMIDESKDFARSCFWFTTLLSKETNLKPLYGKLRKVAAYEVKTIKMKQGNKTSRLLAWTFLDEKVQQIWADSRWGK